MNIEEMASNLGINLKEKKLRVEKKYIVYLTLTEFEKIYTSFNEKPEDFKKAKKIAIKKIYKYITPKSILEIKCQEIIYADVPIKKELFNKLELQPISSKWLSNEEIKKINM